MRLPIFPDTMRPMKGQRKGRAKTLDLFSLIELYAVKVASTIVFLVFVYVVARHEITHLLQN